MISLRFSESDYSKLRDEAASLGLKPAVLARTLVRTGLNAPQQSPARHNRQQVKEILARLDRHVADGAVSQVDVVELIHQNREERIKQLTDTLNFADQE